MKFILFILSIFVCSCFAKPAEVKPDPRADEPKEFIQSPVVPSAQPKKESVVPEVVKLEDAKEEPSKEADEANEKELKKDD